MVDWIVWSQTCLFCLTIPLVIGHMVTNRSGTRLECYSFAHVLLSCCVLCLCLSIDVCLTAQEEDEVPDDETVNQMIARSEEEFDHFMVS